MGVALTGDHTSSPPPPQELLESQLLAVQADLKGLEAIVDGASTIIQHRYSKDGQEPAEDGLCTFLRHLPGLFPPITWASIFRFKVQLTRWVCN